MLLKLFLLFTIVPVLELMLLIEVGSYLGALPTIGICLATGFVGASLARSQGAGVLQRMQVTLQEGGLPARELLDGVLILMAGVVLLTPGFVTDAAGIILLLPPTRAVIRAVLFRWIQAKLAQGTWTVVQQGQGGFQAHWSGGTGGVKAHADVVGRGPEIIPPELAPRPPRPSPPDVIDG
ncbi:MAG: FxsA family protein [Myxococcota bacterium]|nr:FxsA family protein [Myxococcota bacterium]